MTEHLIFLSAPGLRPKDVENAEVTPTLYRWAHEGCLSSIVPTFPCVTSTVQASMWTGLEPSEHGIIGNGFYHRDRREVEFWVARNGIINGEQVWDAIAATGRMTSAVWHAQNIKDAAADYIVTPEPIHEADGTTKLWCYSKPDGLYQQLIETVGHFPLQHYWGPLSNIKSSEWIVAAAKLLIDKFNPNFHYLYIPHLDYASQKFGPDSVQAGEALRDVDRLFSELECHVMSSAAGRDAVFLVASEYAMTDVCDVVYPNILLREHGLLRTHETPDGNVIDYEASRAFAVVDHQCAHIYAHEDAIDEVVALFEGAVGVEGVHARSDRATIGMCHARAGEVVLVARRDHWFAYYWWSDEADAPAFARTVDIHRKPGYDPVELFFDAATKSIPLDASLVRGSHGAPARDEDQWGALICSQAIPNAEPLRTHRDVDTKALILELLGL